MLNRDSPLFLAISLLLTISMNAQTHLSEKRAKAHEVSGKVRGYIHNQYPGFRAKYYKVESVDGHFKYGVNLKKGKKEVYVLFGKSDRPIHIDSLIEYNKIPKKVKDLIEKDLSKRFKKYVLDRCRSQLKNDSVFYKIQITAVHRNFWLFYSSSGEFLNQRKLPSKPLGPIFH
ncbi:MAG: NleF caspase inhibitor [Bacteroidota bacterium]